MKAARLDKRRTNRLQPTPHISAHPPHEKHSRNVPDDVCVHTKVLALDAIRTRSSVLQKRDRSPVVSQIFTSVCSEWLHLLPPQEFATVIDVTQRAFKRSHRGRSLLLEPFGSVATPNYLFPWLVNVYFVVPGF